MTSRMSPAASPGGARTGVRRVNNLPLVFTGLVLLGFLVIMALVAVKRAQPQASGTEEKPQGGNATRFAQSLTRAYPNGLIPAKRPLVPPPPPTPPIESVAAAPVPVAAVDLDHPPLPPRLQSNAPPDPEVQRLRQLKQTAFEDAVKGATSGPLEGWRAPRASRSHKGSPQHGGASIDRSPSETDESTDDRVSVAVPPPDRWRLDSRPESQATAYVLRTGFVIPAVMVSAINSQLPGPVIAQVSQPVYDSATGEQLLIPQGTRLIGVYSNEVSAGQERVFVAWQRLVFPDGQAMDIGEQPGTSGAGLTGLSGEVDTHLGRVFGNALLMSLITAGATYSQQPQGGAGGLGLQTAGSTLSAALGQQLGAAGAAVLMKNLNIAPTIAVHAGYRLTVVATKDLTFDRPYRPFAH
ncbi:TrbI/VirB10 family protein [Methylotetracoccus oryzae]|uniref:TrbI/VirB10 family protein n=1 Tax=Methylotetracoccus oryzae TaxID=1919059 RepID=UPI00111A7907|nr:TrbI/VirB10 family protein [Methylotetracoccus oryzae]